MLELGYIAKRIVTRPGWLDVPNVQRVYAVATCISEDFCDYINYWKHNGFWFFDTPSVIQTIARKNEIELSDTALIYYEGHNLQFDADQNAWTEYAADCDFVTAVSPPLSAKRLGYDVVSYSMQNGPECSPLSCNHVAANARVNEHCLFDSLDYAIACLNNGVFNKAEPGPYRIIAVNEVEWPPSG